MSLMSLFLLLLQGPACLVRLIWMVLKMAGRWPYTVQDLFNITRRILVQFPSSFFSIRLVNIYEVHPYNSMDTTAAWKKSPFILSDRSDFHMIYNLSIADHAFASLTLMSFSVDETLLSRCVNLCTSFREPPFSVKRSHF